MLMRFVPYISVCVCLCAFLYVCVCISVVGVWLIRVLFSSCLSVLIHAFVDVGCWSGYVLPPFISFLALYCVFISICLLMADLSVCQASNISLMFFGFDLV